MSKALFQVFSIQGSNLVMSHNYPWSTAPVNRGNLDVEKGWRGNFDCQQTWQQDGKIAWHCCSFVCGMMMMMGHHANLSSLMLVVTMADKIEKKRAPSVKNWVYIELSAALESSVQILVFESQLTTNKFNSLNPRVNWGGKDEVSLGISMPSLFGSL